MDKKTIFETIVKPLMTLLAQRGIGEFYASPSDLLIDGTSFTGGHEQFEAFYALSGTRALRVEIVDDYVHGIGIWKSLADMNKPDLRIDTSSMNEEEIIEVIAAAFGVEDMTEATRKLFEGFQDDFTLFMKAIGSEVQGKKVATIYRAYLEWATSKKLRAMSYARFSGFVKEQQLSGEAGINVISKAQNRETILVQPEEVSEFEKDIMENEVVYTANLLESTLKRIAADDPGIVSLFLSGAAGLGKSYSCKKILKESGAWVDPPKVEDPSVHGKVVYKSGAIAGFTGLLQLLWDYRSGYILVLDDNDSLLEKGNQKAFNILKAALNSNPEDRWISYTRAR